MKIGMFNIWYCFWIIISIDIFLVLYLSLRNKSDKTKKIVLFSLLAFAFVLHFLKALFPPYSTDLSRLYRDSWFINICGANIGLFPLFFFSKNKYIKDYMFYLGILGGAIAILYPAEPMAKVNQAAEWIDIVRFYVHHNILWYVPLLMVMFKLHKLNYRRLLVLPITFCCVLMFIMINQVLQSELGYIPLRDDNFFSINYKNSSMIWGPDGAIGNILAIFCPNIFKTVPVGANAGQKKYWPLIWLVVPMYILLVPISFLMCLIFDHKHFIADCKTGIAFLKTKLNPNIMEDTETKDQSDTNKE